MNEDEIFKNIARNEMNRKMKLEVFVCLEGLSQRRPHISDYTRGQTDKAKIKFCYPKLKHLKLRGLG